jgi:hypothetical protein
MTTLQITPLSILLGLAINGIFSGLGTAIGIYIANKHVIATIGKLKNKLKKKKRRC